MNIRDFCAEEGGENLKRGKAAGEFEKIKENPGFEEIKNSPEFNDIAEEYGDVVNDFVNNYADKSEPELMQDLLNLIAEKKREGTFDIEKIRALADMVAPMLDPEQRAKMYNLLNFLG